MRHFDWLVELPKSLHTSRRRTSGDSRTQEAEKLMVLSKPAALHQKEENMITRLTVFALAVIVFCVPTFAFAQNASLPPGKPFEVLQQQIDGLTQQLETVSRVTPPAISVSLSCQGPFTVIVSLSIEDDKELAYYAIQKQGGDPPINTTTYVEPGMKMVEYAFTVETGTGFYLFVAGDTEGNVGKSLVDIETSVCAGPCPPGAICP